MKGYFSANFLVPFGICSNFLYFPEGLKGYIEYIFPDIGNYTITVNVSNLVGWQMKSTYIPVQIVIENLLLHRDWPMPHNYVITRFLSNGRWIARPVHTYVFWSGYWKLEHAESTLWNPGSE